MNRIAAVVFALWLVVLTAWLWHERAQRQRSPFEQFCETAVDGVPQCAISLAALAFEPRAADGQMISSRGVLVLDRGLLALYSSQAAFESGDRRQAVQVIVPPVERKALVDHHRGMVVVFRGRIDATHVESTQLGFMAAIRDLAHVEPALLPDEAAGDGDVADRTKPVAGEGG